VLRAHESAQDLEASAKRLLHDLAAKGAGQERVRAFRAAFAAQTDVTRRRRVVSEMLAALEQLERQVKAAVTAEQPPPEPTRKARARPAINPVTAW
jgi:hypothetical protein